MKRENQMFNINHEYWYLLRDEVVKYETEGYLEGNRYRIICTDKKLIFVTKKFLRRMKIRTFHLEWIKSIKAKKPLLLFGSIMIDFSTFRIKIANLFREDVEGLERAIRSTIDK